MNRTDHQKESLLELITLQPDNISARIELFKAYMMEEDYVTALEELDQIIIMEPDNINHLLIKVDVLKICDRIDETIELYQYILKKIPNDMRIKQDLAKVYEHVEEYDLALKIEQECFDTLYCTNIQTFYPHIMELANVYHLNGDTDKAIYYYELCLEHNPHDEVALLQLAELTEYSDKKKFHMYRARLERNDSNIEKAISEYKKALKYVDDEDEEVSIRIEIGILYYMIEKLNQAIDEFNLAKQLQDHFRIYRGLGCCYYELEEYEIAKDMFEEALKAVSDNTQIGDPDILKIHVDLADTYTELGEDKKAIEEYTILLNISERQTEKEGYLLQLARLYIKQEQYDLAKTALQNIQESQEAGNKTTDKLDLLIDIALLEKDEPLIQSCFEKFMKILPNSDEYYLTAMIPDLFFVKAKYYRHQDNQKLYSYYQGLAYEAENKIEEALNEYNDALHNNESDPVLLIRLGNTHLKLKNKPIALEYFLNAQHQDRSNITLMQRIAELYNEYGDKLNVKEWCENILKIQQDHAYGLFQLAVFYDNDKEYEEALGYYQHYINSQDTTYKSQQSFAQERIKQLEYKISGEPDPSSLLQKGLTFLKRYF